MTSRLITPKLAEQLKQYPLYSQDGRRRMPFANAYSSLAISVGMFWRDSPKVMTSHCLQLSLALPKQNMDMRPSRKWRVLI